jgi:tetraacyldisaccharide-1-P 4'-kinase
MTEKDAVKCQAFADDDHWCVPVQASCDELFTEQLERLVNRLIHG